MRADALKTQGPGNVDLDHQQWTIRWAGSADLYLVALQGLREDCNGQIRSNNVPWR